MRRLNFPLAGFLLVALLVSSAVAYGVHGVQVKRHAGVLLREAERAEQRDEIDSALDFYFRFAQLVPEQSAEPLAKLGFLAADNGRFNPAYRAFDLSLRRDPQQESARRRQIEVALRLRRFTEARQHVEFLLKAHPKDGELLEWCGDCEVGQRNYKTADGLYKQALEVSPDRINAFAKRAANMHFQLKDPEQALLILNEMVTGNPEEPRAYILRGSHRLAQLAAESQEPSIAKIAPAPSEGQVLEDVPPPEPELNPLDAIVKDARTALQLTPDDEDAIQFGVAALLTQATSMESGDLTIPIEDAHRQADTIRQEARELGTRGVELFPKNATLYANLADLEVKSLNRDEAIRWLQRGVEAIPGPTLLLWNLANALAEWGDEAEAKRCLGELEKSSYSKTQLRFLAARLMVREEDWGKASKELEALRPLLGSLPMLRKQADFWLGACYDKLGRPDLQMNAYRRASGFDPTWMPARVAYANSLVINGRIDEAIVEFLAIARMPRPPVEVLFRIPLLITMVNRRMNAADQDWTIVNQVQEQLDKLVEAQKQRGSEEPGFSAKVALLKADVLLAQSQEDRAEKLIGTSLDGDPDALELRLALVAFAERRGDWSRARELLDEARSKTGDTVGWRLAKVRHEVNQFGSKAGAAIRELATPPEGMPPKQAQQLLMGMASLALSISDFGEAERLSRIAANASKSDLGPRVILLDIALASQNAKLLDEVLEEITTIDGSGALWKYGEAVRLTVLAASPELKVEKTRREHYAKAKQLLGEAQALRPSWLRLPLLLAKIDDAQRDEQSAITNYQAAIRLGDRSLSTVARVGELLYRAGRLAEADQIIRLLQEQQAPFSNGMKQLAAEVSLRLDDSVRAIDFASKVAQDSTDVKELVWAGRILQSLRKYEEAETSFLRAVELDQTAVDPRIALIQFYQIRKDIPKVEQAIKDAEQNIKPESVDLALAEVYASIGHNAEAETRFKAAIAAAPDDHRLATRLIEFLMRTGKPQVAEPYLRRLATAAGDEVQNPRIFGRRNWALILASRGDQESFDQALKLLAENLSEKLPEHLTEQQAEKLRDVELRTKAMVLVMKRGDPASREAAAKVYEDLIQRHGPNAIQEMPDDHFTLAQVYWTMREHTKAIETLKTLVLAHGNEPRYLMKFVQFLVQVENPDLTEVEFWLTRLRGIAPREFNTVLLTAEVRMKQANYRDLLTMAEDYALDPSLELAERESRIGNVAVLLENLAETLSRPGDEESADVRSEWAARYIERSETLYDRNSQDRPKEALALAAFYARRERPAKALDLLEREWRSARPSEIMLVTSALITSGATGPEDSARAEKILREALSVFNRPVMLLLGLADLQSWREVTPPSAKDQTYDDAEGLYREVLEKERRNAVSMNNLSLLLALRGGHEQEPLQLINQAIAYVGSDPALLDSRATIYLTVKSPQQAIDDLNRSLERRKTALGYFHMAQAYFQLGELESARKMLAKATEFPLKVQELHPLERPALKMLQEALQ